MLVHEKEIKRTLKIMVDDHSGEGPRAWDNLGTMACFHKQYALGDEKPGWVESPDDLLLYLAEEASPGFEEKYYNEANWQGKAWEVVEKQYIILSLYLYDHSGITMRTRSFNDPWDSGQVGWIYVSKKEVKEEYKVKYLRQKHYDEALKVLEAEVEVYDLYLRGETYGYELVTETDGEVTREDSCWGFYGTDWRNNGLLHNIGYENEDLLP